jgi:hypothetical protein
MDDDLMIEFTEKIADRIFDGFFPMNVSAETIAVAVLQSMPLFRDAPADVKRYFLLRFTPMVVFRKLVEADARDADSSSEWKM